MTRGSRRVLLCTALVPALVLGAAGCVTRPVEHEVFDRDLTRVSLRSHKRGASIIDKGYQHPFTIATARLAHILSRIDLRREEGGETKRVPAIPTESIYLIAEGLADAMAKADENQEVVVMSIRRTKRLGIFDRKFLTSFVAYRKDDLLYIHLGLSDWEIPPYREERLPPPKVGSPSKKIRIIPSRGMTLVDTGSVSVVWRDDVFAKPSRTRITPGGKVVRRTILMESPDDAPEAAPVPQPAALPADLTPEKLRELADLEDARRRGELTESQYEAERRRILGADPAAP